MNAFDLLTKDSYKSLRDFLWKYKLLVLQDSVIRTDNSTQKIVLESSEGELFEILVWIWLVGYLKIDWGVKVWIWFEWQLYIINLWSCIEGTGTVGTTGVYLEWPREYLATHRQFVLCVMELSIDSQYLGLNWSFLVHTTVVLAYLHLRMHIFPIKYLW